MVDCEATASRHRGERARREVQIGRRIRSCTTIRRRRLWKLGVSRTFRPWTRICHAPLPVPAAPAARPVAPRRKSDAEMLSLRNARPRSKNPPNPRKANARAVVIARGIAVSDRRCATLVRRTDGGSPSRGSWFSFFRYEHTLDPAGDNGPIRSQIVDQLVPDCDVRTFAERDIADQIHFVL